MSPTLLVDIGSTVVKLCRHDGGRFGVVETVPRDPHVAPGEQVRALVEDGRLNADAGLRVCSSANGGLRVGVLGLSRRHSATAAARAAVAAGGNVVYERLLDTGTAHPFPHVDLLVLVGGVDGADLRHLRERLAAVHLADHPHDVMVWAGAAAPDLVAGLPVDHVVANVLDEHLRPSMGGLADLVHRLYVGDLVDRKGLRALAGVVDAPIWPTPAVVGLAAERLAGGRVVPATAPFVVVDVGGATTDVLYCAELRPHTAARVAPGESIVRQVFTDLGVVGSLPRLRRRLAGEPALVDLVVAVAPERPRALYHEICDGAALTRSASFLACLFLALRQVTDRDGPCRLDPRKIASVVITGGAWTATAEHTIRRVVAAAWGAADGRWSLHVDQRYQVWAHGLLAVPGPDGARPDRSATAGSPGLVAEVGAEPPFDLGQVETPPLGVVRDLVAAEAAHGEVPGGGMGEHQPADRGRGGHGAGLG